MTESSEEHPISAKVKRHDTQAPTGLWHPLRNATFRNLLIANVVSDVGSFMQSVGAAWLMVSLHTGPFLVALTQTAAALPYFLLAMPSGAIGDIVDRRRLILITETWMAVVATILTVLAFSGRVTPVLLLVLTFALAAGDATESPTWRAVLPDLVSKEDLSSAVALNGIEFNLARAVGPPLAGVVIATAGIPMAFAIDAVSFVGVIWVVAHWRAPQAVRTTPRETLGHAMTAALRYVTHVPNLQTLFLRSGVSMFAASGLLALLPSLARALKGGALSYGLLLGCFGGGAVGGALILQNLRGRQSPEAAVTTATVVFGCATIAAGLLTNLAAVSASLLIAGSAWIVFLSLFSVLTLNHTADWVRARVLAVSMLVFQGAIAVGSAFWGAIATRDGIRVALVAAGALAAVSAALALVRPLPAAKIDLTPWSHWRIPTLSKVAPTNEDVGPVLVTVEYRVAPEHEVDFREAVHGYERIRRRDGAYEWGVFRDTDDPARYVEIFLVNSWAEHLRQHARAVRADEKIEAVLSGLATGEPTVNHLIYLPRSG